MVRRRTVLGVATGVAALGVPVVFTALNSGALAAGGLPLTVVNNTGVFGNTAIQMYVVGTDLATGKQGYVKSSGVFTPCALSDNGADGFADLGVPLSTNGDTNFALPKMSGRVYFAINGRLRFKVVSTGNGAALQFPAGWTAADPNFDVLHDCMEFTYSDAGMFCNTTNVDMFSIPMAIRLTGAQNQTTGALVPGGRDRIFAAIAALPDFSRLVIGDKLRVIAPGHGLDAGLFSATYFDPYISDVWNHYASTDLTVTTNAGSFTGRVTGDKLIFSGGIAPFARPSTKDVLYCDGALAAPNDGKTGPVAAVLGAAFNRSTLRDQPHQPTTDPATFYQPAISNHYARVLHANHADGKAYGFAFDDVVNFASYIQDTAPTAITVTLTPFGDANPNPGPTATAGARTAAPVVPVVPPASTASSTAAGGFDAYSQIKAANFTAQNGVKMEACAEGGKDVGYIANGDWLEFRNVRFGAKSPKQFTVRAASGASAGISGLIEIRLDSRTNAPVGTIAVGSTGGWQAWRSIDGTVNPAVSGTHTVYMTFTSGQPAEFINVNWLAFKA